jgi:hypothetical protein
MGCATSSESDRVAEQRITRKVAKAKRATRTPPLRSAMRSSAEVPPGSDRAGGRAAVASKTPYVSANADVRPHHVATEGRAGVLAPKAVHTANAIDLPLPTPTVAAPMRRLSEPAAALPPLSPVGRGAALSTSRDEADGRVGDSHCHFTTSADAKGVSFARDDVLYEGSNSNGATVAPSTRATLPHRSAARRRSSSEPALTDPLQGMLVASRPQAGTRELAIADAMPQALRSESESRSGSRADEAVAPTRVIVDPTALALAVPAPVGDELRPVDAAVRDFAPLGAGHGAGHVAGAALAVGDATACLTPQMVDVLFPGGDAQDQRRSSESVAATPSIREETSSAGDDANVLM